MRCAAAAGEGWITNNTSFEFGPFKFDATSNTLWRDGAVVPLGSRGAVLLGALLKAEGAAVGRELLIRGAWPGLVVEESNLAVQIAALRRTLGPRQDGSPWISTDARVGYRLVREATVDGLPTIAVLPFVAMDEVGSFAEGFVEDLITALSRFRTFGVASRTSTEAFREKPADAREIARALGARYLVEGSVRRTGNRIRLTAQLIDGTTGLHLWSEKLDGELEDIFDFQDRLVSGVVVMFEPHIRSAELARARRKRPDSLDAYDLYLEGLALLRGVREYRPEHFDQAIAILNKAIALDPGFAPALALCASAHEGRLTDGGVTPPGVDDKVEALALIERALKADSSDAMVLMQAGTLRLVLAGDEATALPLLEQAQSLNPNSPIIATVTAYCFWHAGHVEQSFERFLRAIALARATPDVVWPMNGMAVAQMSAGRFEDALDWGLRVLERTETIDFSHCAVAAAYAHLGRQDEAETRVRRARVLWPGLTVHRLLGPKTAPKALFRLLEQGLLKAGMPAA